MHAGRRLGFLRIVAIVLVPPLKQIVVDPGKRLSLQWHQHRAEYWVVVQGTARITIGPETRLVKANQSVFVSLKTPSAWRTPGRNRCGSSRSRPALT